MSQRIVPLVLVMLLVTPVVSAQTMHARVATDKSHYQVGDTVNWTIYAWGFDNESQGISQLRLSLFDNIATTLTPALTAGTAPDELLDTVYGLAGKFILDSPGTSYGYGVVDIEVHQDPADPVNGVGIGGAGHPDLVFARGGYVATQVGYQTLGGQVNEARYYDFATGEMKTFSNSSFGATTFSVSKVCKMANVPEYVWRWGYGPTVGAMLTAVWDNSGKSGLWPGAPPPFNDPGSPEDPVNLVIDELASMMMLEGDGGAVRPSSMAQALVSYALGRDDTYLFSFGSKYVSPVAVPLREPMGLHAPHEASSGDGDGDSRRSWALDFDFVRNEIDAGRPMVLAFSGVSLARDPRNAYGANVLAYGYIDNPGDDNDWIAVRDTWNDGNSNERDGIIARVDGRTEWWKWNTDPLWGAYVYRGDWFAPAEDHVHRELFATDFGDPRAFAEQFTVGGTPGCGAAVRPLPDDPANQALYLYATGDNEDYASVVVEVFLMDEMDFTVLLWYPVGCPCESSPWECLLEHLRMSVGSVVQAAVVIPLAIQERDSPSNCTIGQHIDLHAYDLEPGMYTVEFRLYAGSTHSVYMDDLLFMDPGIQLVPEPASIALLAAGTAALGWLRRRRRR